VLLYLLKQSGLLAYLWQSGTKTIDGKSKKKVSARQQVFFAFICCNQ